MILLAYNNSYYKEFLLPNSMNVDVHLLLPRDAFRLASDILLHLEITEGGWRIYDTDAYTFADSRATGTSRVLDPDQILTIQTRANERLQIFAADAAPLLQIPMKFMLDRSGPITIGMSKDNVIVYDYRHLVSGHHAVIYSGGDGYCYIEDQSSNGIFDAHGRISGRRQLAFGDHINIFGLHLIFLGNQIAISNSYGDLTIRDGYLTAVPSVPLSPNSVRQTPEPAVYFKRSPRNLPPLATESVEIESPPPARESKKRPLLLTIGPSFSMALPMLMGCLVTIYAAQSTGRGTSAYMFTGIVTAVSSALLGVIWALANLRYSKKEEAEDEVTRFTAYSNYLITIADDLREKYDQNRAAMHQMYPAAVECVYYNQRDVRLWNRNINHEDFLFTRLGTGDVPFQVHIETPKEKFTLVNDSLKDKPAMIRSDFEILHDVPVGVDLLEHRLMGLVGGTGRVGAIRLMHAMVAQIAANNCYTDVKLAFIYRTASGERKPDWECMKFFPHVWSSDHQTRYIASDDVERGDVCFELSNLIRARDQNFEADHQSGRGQSFRVKPHVVLFVEDPALLDGELLAKYVLDPKEHYGLTTFLMVETVDQLPNVCEDVIENDSWFCGQYNLMSMNEKRVEIRFDQMDARQLDTMGRSLCGILVAEEEGTSEIPARLDFMEMYGIHRLSELDVLDRWRKNRTYNSMKALIGKKAGNTDCFLDIHEKYHGPHGLIAGTTGSGKSETLQTYMLSMAINFSPDDVSFFVIDFKGGGMAGLFEDLPHMVGQISNLSGNQVRRAMISIKSENNRRQRLFAEYGVNNINLYTQLFKNGETRIAIPHLFIIIDEFAELKREEPEFMRELISVAQVGRSLGVHLILATQKPSGTVDDNIWSNSKFRLCLRVQDRQDSNDMLHKPDAAFITQAGRCYLQVGNDEIYELFQSGYSGAVYDENDDGSKVTAAILTVTGKPAVVGNFRKRLASGSRKGPKKKEQTQLEAVVAYLKQTAQSNGYRQNMQLWLPVLGDHIYLAEVGASAAVGYDVTGTWQPDADVKAFSLETCVGMYDDPVNQAQNPLNVSFSQDGHLIVTGTVSSGKSTFLQTLVYGLINRYSPKAVNIYCLDFSSKMMAAFEGAPQVGGVVFDDETDRISKFFNMIFSILEERKKIFRGGNYSQYVQAYGLQLPAIVIVIDNYGNFTEKTGGAYDSQMQTLSKEGVGHGIYLVMSGAGFNMSEIPTRIADTVRNVISLEMGDKFKYMEVLRTTRLPLEPENGVAGRGLAIVDGRVLEFQTALALVAEDDFDRGRRIQALCARMTANWTDKPARPIPSIPEKPTLADLAELEGYEQAIADPALLPIAYLSSDATVYSIRLDRTYCYTVSGKAHTGRANVLKLIIAAARAKGARLCIIDPIAKLTRTVTLLQQEDASAEGSLTYVQTSKDLLAFFKELLPEFKKRNQLKHELEEQGLEDEMIFERMAQEKPIMIVISDLMKFVQMVDKPEEGVGDIRGFTENILEKGRLHNIYFFGAIRTEDAGSATAYRSFKLFTDYHTGMHLGGNYNAQRIFNFQNIPFMVQSKAAKRGLGAAADWDDDTQAVYIVIPTARNDA